LGEQEFYHNVLNSAFIIIRSILLMVAFTVKPAQNNNQGYSL
jgi:hypothetical protein